MSFSKARIQRFNERTSEVPPPGAYDPKFDGKVKGFSIEKTERFQDGKSVTSSGAECNWSVSSKGGGPVPSPKFRTPQLPKKRVIVKPINQSCPKAKTNLALGKSKELKYDVTDELADLKVECANKDRTIQDHTRQIEDMKKETWRLEKELQELRSKQANMEEEQMKDSESMGKLQQELLDRRDQKHLAEVEQLRLQLSQTIDTREREMKTGNGFEEATDASFANLCEALATLDKEMKRVEFNGQSEIARLTHELAECESSKKSEMEKLLAVIADKEKDLSVVRVELEQLKITSDELRNQVACLEKHRENQIDARNENEAMVFALGKAKDELELKLETRQQVVLELQSQLSTLQCEVDELRAEYERLIKDTEMRMSEFSNRRDRELIDMRHEFICERERLECEKLTEISRRLELEDDIKEIYETNAFLTEELQDVQKLYKDVSRKLKEAQEQRDASEAKHAQESNENKKNMEAMRNGFIAENLKLEQLLESARLEYIRELDNMTEARNNELDAVKTAANRTIEEEKRRIKERSDKIVENAEAVTRETLAACRVESEERVKRVIAETDAKVLGMMRDARTVAEEEMREAADRYAACLARVEAERLVLEQKLEHRDAEIVKLSVDLEELKIVVENQESFSQSLQADLDRVEAELSERKDELKALKDQIRSEAAEMVARRRRFEVVMAENQASVAALSERLAASDAEVERLQNELKTGEDSIVEHRGLLSAMRNTSKILGEEVYALMQKLDASKDVVDQLEAGNLAEIESVRTLFYTEIETLKYISAKEITTLREECKMKDEQNTELKIHLDAMASKLNEAEKLLLKMEEQEDDRVIEISKLELNNEKLMQKLNFQMKATKDSNALLETREAERKCAVDEAERKIAELTARIATFETDKVDKKEVKAMQERHETRLNEEKMRRQAAEEEVKKLSEDCENLRKRYQEVSNKYAEIIGHHNHKQRVKHLNQLKDRIILLEKDVETKKHVIDQQTRTIEKLKAEEKCSFPKGKENLHAHGISRSPYTTPASSPLRPLTPLRDRNE